jgi:hypothetical protein
MASSLFASVDRALQQRARANALGAVRDGKLHAAQRQEAGLAVALQSAAERRAR